MTTVHGITFYDRFKCRVGPSAILAIEVVAKMSLLGIDTACFLLRLCSDSARGTLLPFDARLPIMFVCRFLSNE